MTEDADYGMYTGVLHRSVIPDEATFEDHAFTVRLLVDDLLRDGVIRGEKVEDGIAKAVCMMAEEDYKAAVAMGAAGRDDRPLAGESVQGYSYTLDGTARAKAVELNMEGSAAAKNRWLRTFCELHDGWRI